MQLAPVTEVTPDLKNAEPLICVTESGRLSIFRSGQSSKRKSEIFMRCDGSSNITDENLEQLEKTEPPRIERDEGTVKEVKR
jgi:hypothetical protein